jgi:copper oxidase (laccase) domain-containing protein
LGKGVAAVFGTSAFDTATPQGRAALREAATWPLVFARQVHGAAVHWVTADGVAAGLTPECDVLATDAPGIGLVIRTADCVPVLLADPAAGLVAAAHVGWRGLLAGTALRAVEALVERAGVLGAGGSGHRGAAGHVGPGAAGGIPGARALRAAIGPAICADCYEVDAELASRALGEGHLAASGTGGKGRLDLPGSVQAQLLGAGVETVSRCDQCTAESTSLFSWRARRENGRQAAVVALVGADGAGSAARPEAEARGVADTPENMARRGRSSA